ncbi:MAG TPA: hypothetical protein VFU15_15125 [Bacteroidia bacterium]|nr:hypothetical protein [Bacteroidia bacterium]
MLNRLLFAHQKPALLITAVAGALVGMILLLGTLQLYFDFSDVINGNSDVTRPQYLVINKEVSMLNTFFGGQKGFSADELASLKKISGVKDIAPLTSSKFKVSISMGSGGMQGMPGVGGDLFFEAVPDNFLDVSPDAYQWKEGDSLVPLVIPRDYIKLYNFGFAPAQGLPQLTEGMVGLARFTITIRGSKGDAVFHGKLAAFSERINSILAPQSFLDYANEKFEGVAPGSVAPSRVVIQCDGPATAELADYFTKNGYETSAESLRNSKLNSWLRLVMGFLVGIGAVIIALSALSFLLYSLLLISKSSYEIRTLTSLGYDHVKLGRRYLEYFAVVFSAILVVSLVSVRFIKLLVSHLASSKGFELPSGISAGVFVSGVLFTLVFLGLNGWAVFSGIRNIASGRKSQ